MGNHFRAFVSVAIAARMKGSQRDCTTAFRYYYRDAGGRLALLITLTRMGRRTIPLVEVTDPDGKKSLWVAYAIPHDRAVAAVQDRLPPGHTAELAGRRPPHSRKLEGALHGDIIKLEYDANSALPVQSVFTSARSDRYLRQVPQVAVGDFKETVAQLLAMARNLPPGQKRQDALIEIGRLRNRMYVLLRSANNRTGQKRQHALIEIGKLRNRMYVLLRSANNRNLRIKRADSGDS